MNTTGLVMTVTDELLAELEEAASNATQDAWELLPGTNLSGPEIIANGESIAWVLDSEADAVHIATATPATIADLVAELRRLRAENVELAKDAWRYRWIAKRSTYGIDCRQRPSLTLPIYAPDHIDSLGYSIDTAMAAQ